MRPERFGRHATCFTPAMNHSSTGTTVARFVVGFLWVGGALVACSDDADGTPDAGASSSSSSSGGSAEGGASSSGGSSSGGLRDAGNDASDAGAAHGVFFTEQHYAADFAGAQTQDTRKAYADGICQQAALAAGLLGQYQAVLAVDGPDALPSMLGSGAWCAVHDGTPDCTGEGLVFPDAASFGNGPQHALTTDQLGNATNPSMKFLSGVGVGPDDGVTSLTCNAWSSVDESAGFAGVGMVAMPSAAFGSWLTGGEHCNEVERPLLCIWTPLFGPGPDN